MIRAGNHSTAAQVVESAPRRGGEASASLSAPLTIDSLYRTYAQQVARWVLRLGGPALRPADVEDVVQEVFLIAHRHLASFRGDAKVSTWLFRITHNAVRHRRRRERVRALWRRTPREGASEEVAAEGAAPDELLAQKEAQRLVYQVLDGMNERYRAAFVLFELEGLPGDEVAALLGQKTATLWVWLHRARAQFREGVERLQSKDERRS